MTLDEFLAALRKTPRTWKVHESEDSYHPLRNDKCECPIFAVASLPEHSGMIYSSKTGFALACDIEPGVRSDIISSADFTTGKLRAQLLDACGVQP